VGEEGRRGEGGLGRKKRHEASPEVRISGNPSRPRPGSLIGARGVGGGEEGERGRRIGEEEEA
jgi:hypothetical protein